MIKGLKIGIGILLLLFSAFYALGIGINMADAKKDAVYRLESRLEMEFESAEYVGDTVLTEWGEELPSEDGYGYYRLTFTARNLSSVPFSDNPASAVYLKGENYNEVGWEPFYEGKNRDDTLEFSDAAVPCLPGKAEAKAVAYAQVRSGVDEIYACYVPVWDEEEIQIEIPLR